MARRLRFHLPFAVHHVMLRGNNGEPIFFCDQDRYRMCLLLQEGVERFGHSIHSFCFMTNHVHFAIQVNEINISRIMQNIAFRYTRYINKKYTRVGHLFQGRFKSIIVDGNRYFNELVRYIHLNPVRAGLVTQPEQYVWSSHRAYLMLHQYTWLTRDHILKNFNNSIANYESFLSQGIETELDFKSGFSNGILGDENFVEQFLSTVQGFQKQEMNLLNLVKILCRHFNLSETALRSPGKNRLQSHVRAILSLFIREIEGISIESLATFLNRDPSGLSKLANRLEKKCFESPSLATELAALRKHIQMSECQA